MKESQIQTLLGKWIRDNFEGTAAFELKLCKGKSLPFDAVSDHQIGSLGQVDNDGLYYKIPDMSAFNKTSKPKPFDCFHIQGRAYVVVVYYKPRKPKEAIFVEIYDWLRLQGGHPRKSVREEELKAVSAFTAILK